MRPIPPGSTIGIVGGGQLGRMLALAAAQLGYRCHVLAPEADSVAAEVAWRFTCCAYEDEARVAAFAAECDVVTFEFENVPTTVLRRIAARALLRPGARALEIAQDRSEEKAFIRSLGGRTADFATVDSAGDLPGALERVGRPALLKTLRFGYDGKGQARIAPGDDPAEAWQAVGGQPSILEAFVPFEAEFSILLCRGADGRHAVWPAPRNRHEGGILATSTVPAGGELDAQIREAEALTLRIAEALDYVGVLAAEFFAAPGGPLFNEMAPRVHNSGHWTIEGSRTSQFENHVRAICGLPLGSTALAAPRVEMENLIGDDAERWPAILAEGDARLHLYGKGEGRPGRKMGHVTRLFEA